MWTAEKLTPERIKQLDLKDWNEVINLVRANSLQLRTDQLAELVERAESLRTQVQKEIESLRNS